MQDYEYLFVKTLHQKLKEKIVGKIFVNVAHDELIIKIETYGGLIFSASFGNFSERFMNGFSTEYAAFDVFKQYEKFISNNVLKKYFI